MVNKDAPSNCQSAYLLTPCALCQWNRKRIGNDSTQER